MRPKGVRYKDATGSSLNICCKNLGNQTVNINRTFIILTSRKQDLKLTTSQKIFIISLIRKQDWVSRARQIISHYDQS
jgi:hypothetical protein